MGVSEFLIRPLWAVIPERLRSNIAIQWLKDRLKPFLSRYDVIYSYEFFTYAVDPIAQEAAPIIAQSLIQELRPKRVIDVGCGTGALLKTLQDNGCVCRGLEYAQAGLKFCRSRGLDVTEFDIGHDKLDPKDSYDVAVSIEVAEHLPERRAENYVDLLCGLAPAIVFTAATPGQGGVHHINEQSNGYWISRFEKRGFHLDSALTKKWRSEWERATMDSCFYNNLMVFRRQSDRGFGTQRAEIA